MKTEPPATEPRADLRGRLVRQIRLIADAFDRQAETGQPAADLSVLIDGLNQILNQGET